VEREEREAATPREGEEGRTATPLEERRHRI
jgi:hypothetical protein